MLKLKLQYFGQLMPKSWLIGKDPHAGRDWGQEEKGTTVGVQVQQPEEMSGVGRKWCSLWLEIRYYMLFQASGFLLYFFKNIRSEVWHFQFPLTQIIVSLLPFRRSSCFSNSLRIMFTCDYIVTHAYVWAAYHIPQFISYLSKSCLPLVS